MHCSGQTVAQSAARRLSAASYLRRCVAARARERSSALVERAPRRVDRTSRLRTVGWLLAFSALSAGSAHAAGDIWGKWAHLGDFAGYTAGGPPMADFQFLPLNEDGRMRGESWNPGIQAQPERQCFPHSAVWAPFGPTPIHIWDEGDRIVIRMQSNEVLRSIWMDGRSHPPAHALHTWSGFSTGEWVGDTLKITTTHNKEGFIRRNGVYHSDRAVVIEYITRHDGYLTDVVVVEDPVYLTAPLVREQSYRQIPADTEIFPYTCEQRWPVELGPEPFHFTPHYLPGENPVLQRGRVREDTFSDQEESEINRLLNRR